MNNKCPKCGANAIIRLDINHKFVDTYCEAECGWSEDATERLDRLSTVVEEVSQDADMADGCLRMIRDELIRLGCKCGPDAHKETPAMMYPEWINCCLLFQVGREREECALLAEHNECAASPLARNTKSKADMAIQTMRITQRLTAAAIRARGKQK